MSSLDRRLSYESILTILLLLFPSTQQSGIGLRPEDTSHHCGRTHWHNEDKEGLIFSPNTPKNYPNNNDCKWNITASFNKAIKLEFKFFDVELCRDCRCDWLKVYDGEQLVSKYCGSQIPPTYTAKSHTMRLEFHSDTLDTGRGFEAVWNKIDQGCVKTIEGTSGGISDPNYPLPYPTQVDCAWTIKGDPGTFVQMDFHASKFNLGDECSKDKLEVYDIMPSQAVVKRGEWLGTDAPPTLVSFGSTVLVKLTSDTRPKKKGQGFYAEWHKVYECGGQMEDLEGQLVSFDYKYVPTSTASTLLAFGPCIWDIVIPEAFHIHLTIHQAWNVEGSRNFEIMEYSKSNESFVSYQGCHPGVIHQPLTSLTHNVTSADVVCEVNSKSPKIRVVYNKVYDVPAGFYATWKTVCGQNIDTSTGSFHTPNFGIEYSPDLDCEWVITTQQHDAVVRLTLEPDGFDIEESTDGECTFDYVEVLEYFHEGQRLKSLGRFCGIEAPPVFISETNRVVVRFHSDHHKNGRGFQAHWDSTCGHLYHDLQGNFSSPHHPEPYSNDEDCYWEIRAPKNYVINLRFKEPFGIESNDGCLADHVEVFNYKEGNVLESIGRWCGQEVPPLITSTTPRMFVVFQSDGHKNDVGFVAEWESTPRTCGGRLDSSKGYFTSPDHPLPYPNNLECRWEIHVTEGHRIKLDFGSTFELEMDKHDCRHDSVEILNAFSNGTLISKGKWCSVWTIPVFYSTSTSLVVVFKTDGDKVGRGFNASWETIDKPKPHHHLFGLFHHEELGCGGIYHAEKAGHLMSPNFPSHYDEYVECRWEIKAPTDGSNFTLHFDQEFGLEASKDCSWDYVQISKGNDVIGRWCGNDVPPDVTSGDFKPLVVELMSDKSTFSTGFFASWNRG